VKGHNERRFGIAWTAPAPRMRDYVMALRAVWTAWETRGRLNFDSPHYKLTLMTPDFSPEPTGLPMVAVTVAAVGEAMLRVAGQVGDGVRLHPLCSRAYLEQVCLPQMMEGMRRSGRSRLNFDVHGGGFVCTGPDEATVAAAMEKARRRIGFYGSTRTYLPILALHGLEDLGAKLHRMSVEGQWDRMGAEISDDAVRIFAACGTYDTLPSAIEQRFGGVADSVDIHFPAGIEPGLAKELVTDIRRIPNTFAGFNTNW
jgi:probable F420-dependent oxidoreductase